ncbi:MULTISPECIES: MerR family transcriptional regulator [Microbacterium]|uniref:MerR family transcriptional regulator n=1 Tax=Microbacterium TaxID=33882 RepID=UPI00217D3882|nr:MULTISPECIES: MerR family transcriptional regulator [Microbacterium]UWF77665.1 MerR family transcriptional regulator [Microbacterium neungamense]WCM55834.1 MerR family transcriptional regulator [Microbacterium sp. EF45047]
MRLSDLSRVTGASIASLKFWMREGILPPGELRNQTTAVYGRKHLHRVALIQTLRAEFDASIDRIRALTALIDDPAVSPLEVMENCQLLATGLAVGDADPTFAEQIRTVAERVGWGGADSAAARALAVALEGSARVGYAYTDEDLVRYARMLEPIAVDDIDSIHPEGTLDEVARNLLVAAAAQNRVLVAMNQMAHTAVAIRATDGDG